MTFFKLKYHQVVFRKSYGLIILAVVYTDFILNRCTKIYNLMD